MELTKERIVGQLVAEDYRTATVFKNYEIDFCCNGNKTIAEACKQKNIDTRELIEKLQQVLATNQKGNTDFTAWPLDLLADYIEKNHHRFVRKKIEEITPLLHKVVKVHGDRHPELISIQELFTESAADLTMHMQKEEKVLFPFIRQMVEAEGNSVKAHFGTVQKPIAMMNHEHDVEGERFRKISGLSNNYIPPDDACGTYKVTYALLKEFEDDLYLHIHLENNILFPEAIKMEASMTEN